jgi:NADPH2:quinone reductase
LLYQKNISLYGIFLTRERKRLEEMGPLLERNQIRPRIDAVFPLQEVTSVHERLDSRHGRGKVVLQVAAS